MRVAQVSDADILEIFERLALSAGKAIMKVFNSPCDVRHKSDLSPVTEADEASEKIILEGLRAAFPETPCVAEEECAAGIAPPALGECFFLIDPLDGTKEFVKRGPDFTVNIALVRECQPVVGVVLAPSSRILYSGRPGYAEAIEISDDFTVLGRRRIMVRAGTQPLTIVASRSHRTPETDAYILKFSAAELVSIGSSLKFCLVAAGEADVYPRFGRTMEWDTAAGDAVLRAAGGRTETADGKPLTYGKRSQPGESDFANPAFISRGLVELSQL